MKRTFQRHSRVAGVTLMELMTVVVIICIMAVLLYPAFTWYQERARKVVCSENLKGLYTSTASYLNANNGVWPQIPFSSKEAQNYARSWHDLLQPYGMAWSNFICPSFQIKSGKPDFTQKKYHRSDYMAMPFDDKQWTARKWDRQPWFTERQDMHGGGNLLVLANGTIIDLNDAKRLEQQRPAQ